MSGLVVIHASIIPMNNCEKQNKNRTKNKKGHERLRIRNSLSIPGEETKSQEPRPLVLLLANSLEEWGREGSTNLRGKKRGRWEESQLVTAEPVGEGWGVVEKYRRGCCFALVTAERRREGGFRYQLFSLLQIREFFCGGGGHISLLQRMSGIGRISHCSRWASH